jgi:cytochrome c-type biogenesis protein CcsB
MTPSTSPFVRFLRFLGKVQFTTVLLLGGAIIMIVGTIVESRESREVAWSVIYGTLWFDVFLFLLGVNLVVAVINRIPIRRHQWPFVVTHFAIVALLAGAWISNTFGYEGRLMVFEGSEEHRLFMEDPEIRARWQAAAPDATGAQTGDETVEAVFPVATGRRLTGRVLQQEGEGRPEIRIAEQVENGAAATHMVEAGPTGAPGVDFVLSSGDRQIQRWLIAGDPRYSRVDLGPIEIEFRRAEPEELLADRSAHASDADVAAKPRIAILLGADAQPYVRVTDSGGQHDAAPIAVGQAVALDTLGLNLQLQRLLERAQSEFHVHPVADGAPGGTSYIRLEVAHGGERQSLWLGYGAGAQVAHFAGGGRLELAFGPERRPLPFAIALDEFSLVHHPGSNRPSQYASRVQVKPLSADLAPQTSVISMNRPLDVAGFRLFQSSYRLGQRGGPDATILTVSYDPGVPIVYGSFVLIILGIAWGLRGVRPKAEHAAPAHDLHHATPLRSTHRTDTTPAAARRASGSRAGVALLLLAAAASFAPALRADAGVPVSSVDATRDWVILTDGRAKPLQTFANETALMVTGRESFDGLSALQILWGYALDPEDYGERPYLRVDSLELKGTLGLPADEKRFSFHLLLNNPQFRTLYEQARQSQQHDQKLSRLENDTLSVYAKLDRLAGLMSGDALTIVPLPDESGAWRSTKGLREAHGGDEGEIYVGLARLDNAFAHGDAKAFEREARALGIALRDLNPAVYPAASRIERELFYEDFNAFGKAWKLYLLGFLVLMLLGFTERPWGYVAGTLLIGAGFALHTVGLGTRWAIAGRAPVSDMYESLIFMGWGAIAFGLLSEAFQRKRFLAIAAGLTGFLCLAFAEKLPIDSAINPLVPVLAHTSWLAIHVMTIMLSYSALALAMVVGHAGLFVSAFQSHKTGLASTLSKVLYRTLQIGVLFLAAGIIFGAVWANESWGRYWGWDPKETWSLITLFVYLAIIHARFAGWLAHFGLAASAVMGFLAVVMTYYGVNFILAAGLHSYGFSEGGQFYVTLYAVIEIVIVAGAYLRHRSATGPMRIGMSLPGGDPRAAADQESPS